MLPRPPARLAGDLTTEATSIASVDEAEAGAMTFCRGKGRRARHAAQTSRASIIFVEALPEEPPNDTRAWIQVDGARDAFGYLLDQLFSSESEASIAAEARIDSSAQIGENVTIGPFSYIGANAVLGKGTRVGRHVTVAANCRIGRDVVIQDGTVVGAEGQGYYEGIDGGLYRFMHLGVVLVKDSVHIGANCVVARGMLNDTVIAERAKLAQGVVVGHNVVIGEGSFVGPSVTFCGSAKVGAGSTIGAGATINNGVKVGGHALVGIGSVVTKAVREHATVFGNPAGPLRSTRSA